jgi:hypothetical protein
MILQSIRRAGLGDILDARLSGDMDAVRAGVDTWRGKDLMALGALADLLRAKEIGSTVKVHVGAVVPAAIAGKGLALLRDVAVARILASPGAAVIVDARAAGLELAQVALGFGGSELVLSLTNKRGLPIAEDALKKVKGQGMVPLVELQKREIERVLVGARRSPVFMVPEETRNAHAE